MQHVRCFPGGPWHRLSADRLWTACGKSSDGCHHSRDETFSGYLCRDGCFSLWELGRSSELAITAASLRQEMLALETAREDELMTNIRRSAADAQRKRAEFNQRLANVAIDHDEEER